VTVWRRLLRNLTLRDSGETCLIPASLEATGSGRTDALADCLRGGRSWRNLRLLPKSAFSSFPPIHRADLKGQQRVDSGPPSTDPSGCHVSGRGRRERLPLHPSLGQHPLRLRGIALHRVVDPATPRRLRDSGRAGVLCEQSRAALCRRIADRIEIRWTDRRPGPHDRCRTVYEGPDRFEPFVSAPSRGKAGRYTATELRGEFGVVNITLDTQTEKHAPRLYCRS
jgi:hypothetical protein